MRGSDPASLADTNQRACSNDSSPMACPRPGQDFYGQDAQYGWDVTNRENARYARTTPATNQPVVEDNVTDLMWQGCAAGLWGETCDSGSANPHSWSHALDYCDGLSWGGHRDWRLPDPYELSSIVDRGRADPAIDLGVFPATPIDVFWSSSADAYYRELAWRVEFSSGYVLHHDKSVGFLVRCVRGGP